MWTFDDASMTFDQIGFTFDGGTPIPPPPVPPPFPPPPNPPNPPFPPINWLTEAQFVAYLAFWGANVGVITYVYSSTIPLGYVITDVTPYLNTNNVGKYIPIEVSNGPAPAVKQLPVPNVVGMFYQDALQALNYWGLLVNPPALAISATVDPQYVISQSIAAGTLVNPQTPITITVSGFTVLQQPGIPTAVL
jgi:beta-lactam-binding protein with PASTA domain